MHFYIANIFGYICVIENKVLSKKIYFASDFHLGVPNREQSLAREKRIVAWLESIRHTASDIYLVGDVFDFWFEYRSTVPKGFVRLLGKLGELSDSGIAIHFFTGNHDMWAFDYLEEEIGVKIHREPVELSLGNKKFMIGHGDGLGPGDHGYKFIKKVFANKFCQWLFARLHPNLAFGLANYFSKKSRIATGTTDEVFLGEEKEWLVIYCREILALRHIDYFIFGHRHLPLAIQLTPGSRYINLGEWINYSHYAVFDGEQVLLEEFKN
jgi:UDP-2,3-diacylglucosamine hydrolase